MYKNVCALEAGGSLDQAGAAYREEHLLDHDETEIEVEHNAASFRDPDDSLNYFLRTYEES